MTYSIVTPRKMRTTDFYSAPGVRLWNPTTQMFLHMSGQGETKYEAYSWRGFVHQADALMAQAESEGREWVYLKRKVRFND